MDPEATVADVDTLTGPFAIAALVIAVGGAAKLLAPEPTAMALAALGGPSSPVVPRLMGAAELALGAVAIAIGGRPVAVVVAVAYLAFAAFVLLARRHGGVASCGCFGRSDTPPSLIHVAVNLAGAGVAIGASFVGLPALDEIVADQPAAGVPFVLAILAGTYLVYALLTVVPELLAASRAAAPAVGSFRLVGPVGVAAPTRRLPS